MKSLNEIISTISTLCEDNDVEIYSSGHNEFSVYRTDGNGMVLENIELSGIIGDSFKTEVVI